MASRPGASTDENGAAAREPAGAGRADVPDQGAADRIVTRNPSTGAVVGRFDRHDEADVAAALERARDAAAWWRSLGFARRRAALLAVRAAVARRAPEIAALMHAETGKPERVGYSEVLIAGEHLTYAARHAERVLGPRRVPGSLATITQSARLDYEPLGVVALVTPWNFPLAIPLSDLASALGAGNAVLFKPSEYATATGAWIVERIAEVLDGRPVVQLVTGDGTTGAALVSSGIDKVAFTGSVAVGRRIAEACAATLTPTSLELGGNDALIVDADADLDAAVEGAMFGAFMNSGQLCISIERAFVVDAVHDEFVRRLVARLDRVRCGGDPGAALGPLTLPRQADVVRAHLEEALARGARAVLGGSASIRPPFVDPIVLVDVPADARVLHEETFGPVLPIMRVRDADEAVERANASPFGLGAAVYARRRGLELARRLRVGGVAVNAVHWFYASPHLPFGASGRSGWGVTHGPDGLRNFARPRGVTTRRFDLGRFGLDRLEMHPRVEAALPRLARLLHGRAPRR